MSLARALMLGFISLACNESVLTGMSPQQLRALGVQAGKSVEYAPQPDYPLAARVRHLTGAGLFVMRVDVKTGRVADVSVFKGTGHPILDQAALRAFTHWRFKAGALKPIDANRPQLHLPLGKEHAILKIPCDFTIK
jgi:TonB family protein